MNVIVKVKSKTPYEQELKSEFKIFPQKTIEEYVAKLVDTSTSENPILYIQNNGEVKKFKILYDNTKADIDISSLDEGTKISTEGNSSFLEVIVNNNEIKNIGWIKKDLGNVFTLGTDIQLTKIGG